jgi:hypothetical protein
MSFFEALRVDLRGGGVDVTAIDVVMDATLPRVVHDRLAARLRSEKPPAEH